MESFTDFMRRELNKSKRLSSPLIKVRHVKGSGYDESPIGNSWKDYWLEMSKRNETYKSFPDTTTSCPCCGMQTKPEDFVGGHVEKVDDSGKVYICPVCNSCNSKYRKGGEKSPEFYVHEWDCEEVIEL